MISFHFESLVVSFVHCSWELWPTAMDRGPGFHPEVACLLFDVQPGLLFHIIALLGIVSFFLSFDFDYNLSDGEEDKERYYLHLAPWSQMAAVTFRFANLNMLQLIQAAQLHLRNHLPYETDHAAILCSLEWARLCHVKDACVHLMRCHRTSVD